MKKQTTLHGVRVRVNDVTWNTSFIFPFFNAAFHVRFLLIIVNAGHFVVYEQPRWERRMLVISGRRPLPLAEVQPDLFHHLFHFDPWWTMRGAAGVSPALRQAVVASNLAARRWGHLVVREVVFGNDFQQATEVQIGDGVFRAFTYNPGKPVPWDLQQAFFGRPTASRHERGPSGRGYRPP